MLPDSPYKGKKVHLFWAAAVSEYMKYHTVWQHASLKKFFDPYLLTDTSFPFDPFLSDDLKKQYLKLHSCQKTVSYLNL